MKKRHPKPRLSQLDVGGIVQAMAYAKGSASAWDNFTASPIGHPELEAIRRRCLALPALYPPEASGEYCGPEGRQIMCRIADGLFRFPGARRKASWKRLIHGDHQATEAAPNTDERLRRRLRKANQAVEFAPLDVATSPP